MTQTLFFLNKNAVITVKDLTITIKDIQDDNKIKVEINSPLYYEDELNHQEIISEDTPFILANAEAEISITPLSVIKNSLFACTHLKLDLDKGNYLTLEPDQMGYLQGYSPVNVAAQVGIGDTVTFYKPSGVTISEEAVAGDGSGTTNIPLTANQLDEEGIWSVVLDSPSRNAITTRFFYVEETSTQHTHTLDLVFQALSFQNVDDLFQTVITNLDSLQGDIISAMATIPDQDFSFLAVDKAGSQVIVRVNVILRATTWNINSLAGLLSSTILARLNLGAPAGYILYDLEDNIEESQPWTVAQILSINKSLVKTQIDLGQSPVDILSLDRKCKAETFPKASVASLDETATLVQDWDESVDSRTITLNAIRLFDDSATSIYPPDDFVFTLPASVVSPSIPSKVYGTYLDNKRAVMGAIGVIILIIMVKLYLRKRE